MDFRDLRDTSTQGVPKRNSDINCFFDVQRNKLKIYYHCENVEMCGRFQLAVLIGKGQITDWNQNDNHWF